MKKLLEYLKATPHNTNLAIVKQMINDLTVSVPIYEVSYESDVTKVCPEFDAVVEHIKNNENYVLKIKCYGASLGHAFYGDYETEQPCFNLVEPSPDCRVGIARKNSDGTWTIPYVGP